MHLGVQAVPLWGGKLLYSNGTKGDALKGPQVALGVRGQFFRHSLAAKLVAHLVHSPGQRGIALGRAARLGVPLFQLEGQRARLVLHRK